MWAESAIVVPPPEGCDGRKRISGASIGPMRMSNADACSRVGAARHGVLGTRHEERGVDLVPVVFATDVNRRIFIPIDTVKAKSTPRLQRLENLRNDPRCALLVERYDDDWSRLWWVRIAGTGAAADSATVNQYRPLLADRYPQYAEPGSISSGIVIEPAAIRGWRAG